MAAPKKLYSGDKLLAKVRRCLAEGNYQTTHHSVVRRAERNVTLPEIIYVLETGRHEPQKDSFDSHYEQWNFAILGKTIDAVPLRVAVTFDENDMLILTVINLNMKDK